LLTVVGAQSVDLQITGAPSGTERSHVTDDVSVATNVGVLDVKASSV